MPETPRPWVVFDETTIVSPQGDAEVGTWLVADCRWKDDAELIVRAVNSHDRIATRALAYMREHQPALVAFWEGEK